MPRIALSGGAYQARSVIASAQTCVNLYAEALPEVQNEPARFAYYPTPGLRVVATAPDAGWRGLYRSTKGALYGVSGITFYAIGPGWGLTKLGTLDTSGPVGMADNGVEMLLVDGSINGWFVDLATNAVSAVQDEAFYGANRVGALDGFFTLNRPGTNQAYLSNNVSRTFDPLYLFAKAGNDTLVSLAVIRRELWLFGERTTEIYANTGAPDFPLAIVSGGIEHGCVARHSVARTDGAVLWLGQDADGSGIAFRGAGYQATRISTHALEGVWQGYDRLDDATGGTYQKSGHTFYALSFPSADATWAYDLATGEWHQWRSGRGRHRASCYAFAYGRNVAGDFQTGDLYVMDPDVHTDAGAPIRRERTFPHLIRDGRRVSYRSLVLDMECGTVADGQPEPMVALRVSDDRGTTFGDPVEAPLGDADGGLNSIRFQPLGMARDRVFRIEWDAPVPTALQGAWIHTEASSS